MTLKFDEGQLTHYNRAEKRRDTENREKVLRSMALKDPNNVIHSNLVGGKHESKREAKFRSNNISVDYKVVIPRNQSDNQKQKIIDRNTNLRNL